MQIKPEESNHYMLQAGRFWGPCSIPIYIICFPAFYHILFCHHMVISLTSMATTTCGFRQTSLICPFRTALSQSLGTSDEKRQSQCKTSRLEAGKWSNQGIQSHMWPKGISERQFLARRWERLVVGQVVGTMCMRPQETVEIVYEIIAIS